MCHGKFPWHKIILKLPRHEQLSKYIIGGDKNHGEHETKIK
jgi:hypothetical protein